MIQIYGNSANEVTFFPHEVKKFPGGEVHVTVRDGGTVNALTISAAIRNSDDVMELLMVTDALRRSYAGADIHLNMPYVPYARQDRVANLGEALSAKVFCELINSQQYAAVHIQDPHSDVVAALLDRVHVRDPIPFVRATVDTIRSMTTLQAALVAPDAGARKRVHAIAGYLGLDVVHADKVRDTRTGAITGTQIQSQVPATSLLVIDDICDGGRTFTELAAAIRARGFVKPLYLYVTHGIFSKGLDPLLECYDHIFTGNNWTDDDRCTVVTGE